MGEQSRTMDGGDGPGTAVPSEKQPVHTVNRKARRRHAVARLLAAGVGLGALARFGAQPAHASNGDPVLAGQTVDATAPTRVRNGVSVTPDSTADGIQGYATGANNSGLFGRNNVTDGIGVSGAAPSGTGVFGESINGFGVGGRSTSGVGVRGESASGLGAAFAGGLAAIRLTPAASGTGAPTSGAHQVGELYADSTGALYYCTVAGTPGTWQAVALGSGGGAMTNPMTTQDDLIVGGASGAPARLAKGSNGQVLTLNSSGHVSWATPSGGGGGGSGSWMAPLTAPPTSGWTWVNQGSATHTSQADAQLLNIPGTAGTGFRALVRSTPSSPYTITAALSLLIHQKNVQQGGIVLRNSGGSQLVVWGLGYNSGQLIFVVNMNNETSWSSTASARNLGFPSLLWFRLVDDGTNRVFSYSLDGRNWTQQLSQSRTSFLTANQIGFCADAGGNDGIGAAASLVSWDED